MKKIRTLTYHYPTNNGAVLQAYSLVEFFKKTIKNSDIKIIDYKSPKIQFYELCKILVPHKNNLFFGLKRYIKFKKFINENLPLEKTGSFFETYDSLTQKIIDEKPDLIVVGSDNVWRISNDRISLKIPNIYWLSEKISSKKVAYAVSAFGSKEEIIKKNKSILKKKLDSFNLVGARDQFTLNLLNQLGSDKNTRLIKIPDPTFIYKFKKTNIRERLISKGIDLKKPILGILLHHKEELSKKIRNYFKHRGYQIIALSMYNPYADLNLGADLNPFEWADTFKYFDFCITERFHGTIFCLKSKIPFISIEPVGKTPLQKSKLFDLLADFNMQDKYENAENKNFDVEEFLNKCEKIILGWDKKDKSKVERGLIKMKRKSYHFIKKVRELII